MDEQARRQAAVTFLTTEHFTLQGARTAAISETNSRLQLYMGVLSSAIVALALVSQISRLGMAFYDFALLTLPVVYFLGIATIGRLNQSWLDWFRAGQGMSRIRHYFVEVAPEAEPYLIMPTSDDPWETLRGSGIEPGGRISGLFTAYAVVGTINSVVAGVIGALVGAKTGTGSLLPWTLGLAAFLTNFVVVMAAGRRGFYRRMRQAEVHFPSGDGSPPR